MKRIVCAAFAAFLFIVALPNVTIAQENDADQSGCGKERWPVKTLVDADVSSVNFTPKSATVTQLRALYGGKSPFKSTKDAFAANATRLPAEKQVYRVRAVLVGWKKEADRDFHIVIADPNDPKATMIVEPPDKGCSSSPKADLFAKVRAAFIQCFGEPSGWKTFPHMIVDLDGPAMYDVLHGQTGVAPNGIELHPLLRVHTVSGSCPGGSQ